MSTIYTINGKVLKNVTTGKWLAKKEAPAGFVMNGSNATITATSSYNWVSWESPSYPNGGYNGNGKQFILVNTNSEAPHISGQMIYSTSTTGSGPTAITSTDILKLGTSTGTMSDNMAGGDYGKYLNIPFGIGISVADLQAYLENFSITIVDP